MRRKASGHAISDNCRPSLKTAPGMDPAHQYVLPEQKWLADLYQIKFFFEDFLCYDILVMQFVVDKSDINAVFSKKSVEL